MPAKLFALSFVGIILVANIWFAQSVFGGQVAGWVPKVFSWLIAAALVSGIVMTALKVLHRFCPSTRDLE